MTIREKLRNRQQLITYVILFAAMIGGFTWQNVQADERREQICTGQIEDRVAFQALVNFVVPEDEGDQEIDPTLPENIRKLIEESRANSEAFRVFADVALTLPPRICDGSGIDPKEVREELRAELQERLKEASG